MALLITCIATGGILGSIVAVTMIKTFSTTFYYILDRLMKPRKQPRYRNPTTYLPFFFEEPVLIQPSTEKMKNANR